MCLGRFMDRASKFLQHAMIEDAIKCLTDQYYGADI